MNGTRSKGSQRLPPKNRIDRLLAEHPRRRRSPVSHFCYQAARKRSWRIAGINHGLLAILQAQNQTRSLSLRPATGGRCTPNRPMSQWLGAVRSDCKQQIWSGSVLWKEAYRSGMHRRRSLGARKSVLSETIEAVSRVVAGKGSFMEVIETILEESKYVFDNLRETTFPAPWGNPSEV